MQSECFLFGGPLLARCMLYKQGLSKYFSCNIAYIAYPRQKISCPRQKNCKAPPGKIFFTPQQNQAYNAYTAYSFKASNSPMAAFCAVPVLDGGHPPAIIA